MDVEAKPQCGGDRETGEYDLPLHVGGLFLVLAASIFGAGFPVAAKKIPWLKIPPKVFFVCKHFGTGVLIATAFVHLLPVAFASLTDPCLPDFFIDTYEPFAGVVMMSSMFILFVIEMYLHAKTGGHNHGGPTGNAPSARHSVMPGRGGSQPRRPPRFSGGTYVVETETESEIDLDSEKELAQRVFYEKQRYPFVKNPFDDPNNAALPQSSEMPPWFIVFYEQYVRQRLEMMNMIQNYDTVSDKQKREYDDKQIATVSAAPQEQPFFDAEGQTVDPAVYRKMSMNITLLEGGILFHSIFVGITISLTIDGFLVLLIAILFHQMFEGLGLGSRIAEVPYPKKSPRPWILVIAFGTTAPIGQAIGLVAKDSYDPDSALGLIIVGVFNAISSGLLLYAALVDLLAEDFLSEEADRVMTKTDKKKAFGWVLLGALGMSVVGAFA